jgi:hypothetical protein
MSEKKQIEEIKAVFEREFGRFADLGSKIKDLSLTVVKNRQRELSEIRVKHTEKNRSAFGFGLERMCLPMYSHDDIRLMFENDVGILEQFR